MNETQQEGTKRPLGSFRPKLAFYHANARGTGGALQLELHPAHDDTDGSIMATFATQLTIGDRLGAVPVYPRFDWEGAITVKLDFTDISKMLQVFRGECESIGDGQGLFHRAGCGQTRITLRHLVEPIVGYSLDLYRTLPGGQETSSRFFFSPAEALGLTEAVCGSMAVICFGIPMAQTASAERAESAAPRRGKEAVDVAAA